MIAVAASGSVGETMAPRTNARGPRQPGDECVRDDGDDDHRQRARDRPRAARRPHVRAQVAQRGEERGPVEERRQDADEDEVRRQVDLRQARARSRARARRGRAGSGTGSAASATSTSSAAPADEQREQVDEVVVAELGQRQALVAQLAQRRLRLLELEPHPAQESGVFENWISR